MRFRLRSCWRNIVGRGSVHPVVILTGLLLCLFCGCDTESGPATDSPSEPVTIAVTSYPLLAMAEEMAGSAADVELIVDGESSSPDWKPTPDAIRKMQQATRILISGGDYEPWLQRVTVPRSRLVDTAEGYYSEFIRIPDAVIHQHGPDGSHSHPGVVWATWLDPRLAVSQLERTRDVLVKVLPDSSAEIRQAADGLSAELGRVELRLEEIATSTADQKITVLGDAPVYQYLVQRLGWDLHYVHLPGQGPLTEHDRQSMADAIQEHQPQVVFVRTTLSDELALLKGDGDISFVPIDLCEFVNADRSLAERLMGNLDRIEALLP